MPKLIESLSIDGYTVDIFFQDYYYYYTVNKVQYNNCSRKTLSSLKKRIPKTIAARQLADKKTASLPKQDIELKIMEDFFNR